MLSRQPNRSNRRMGHVSLTPDQQHQGSTSDSTKPSIFSKIGKSDNASYSGTAGLSDAADSMAGASTENVEQLNPEC
ncbi:hypothetical protein Nepgr_024726 [Nepenthes gracilis]|uniref:Uncharacterized protein n=1 Tax=Nepenthes gracilis TaxID=150966 RepID=A0AAD3T4P9_NEPGR|nr:hypothetical protein Nepgr_024726 [Nepenthes gracilis]